MVYVNGDSTCFGGRDGDGVCCRAASAACFGILIKLHNSQLKIDTSRVIYDDGR